MFDLQSLADRIFYQNRREYTVINGDIAYLDGAPLRRPFQMPIAQKIVLIVIVVAAIVLGYFFVNDTLLSSMRNAERTEQAIASNLEREGAIKTLPNMQSVILLNDDQIRQQFQQAGYTIYDVTSTSESDSLVLWKLPSDVSTDDAALFFKTGIGKLDAEQASLLLNGSWQFKVDRVNGTSMVVYYSDFSTGDPQVAQRNALEAQGFDPNSVTDSGTDESGNNYITGTVNAGETPCQWRINVLPLDDMYDISGLPKDACYVGIRITVA